MRVHDLVGIAALAVVVGCTATGQVEAGESRPTSMTNSDTGRESGDLEETTEADTEMNETGTASESETGECVPGALDCPCDAGDSCDDGLLCLDDLCVVNGCGDGLLSSGEACDDGNTIDSDGCNADCEKTRVVKIDAGGEHTCALLNSGDVKCWGRSSFGQLGQANPNTLGDAEPPASAPMVQLGAKAIDVGAGSEHTCVLLESGDVMCWGQGSSGQLGYANTDSIGDNEHPWSAGSVEIGGSVAALAVGDNHNCVILDSGYVTCWGEAGDCRLGSLVNDGNHIGDNEHPGGQSVLDVGGLVIGVSAGGGHTCALLDGDGGVVCWGRNDHGQLGHPSNTDTICLSADPQPIPLPGLTTAVDLGSNHSCGLLLNTEQVTCWGDGAQGALGSGNTNNIGENNDPGQAIKIGPVVPMEVAAGMQHTCILTQGGEIICWGDGLHGKLGYASESSIGDDEHPVGEGFVDIGGSAQSITAGGQHTCALRDDDEVVCWGQGSFGRLGYGMPVDIGDNEKPAAAGTVDVF